MSDSVSLSQPHRPAISHSCSSTSSRLYLFGHLELEVVGWVHLDLKARCLLLALNKSERLVTKQCTLLISYLLMALLTTKHASSALIAKEPCDKLRNYSSMEGVLYCKPHYAQLFKETGSFKKNFQSPAKQADKTTPELTRFPSKAASMFSGTQEKCATRGKTAYPLEKIRPITNLVSNSWNHGSCPITPSNYAALEGVFYCKHHFSQLFKEKGSYNHLIKSASIKRAANSVPQA